MQKVISNIASLDPYLQHGCVCVQKNDKFFQSLTVYCTTQPSKRKKAETRQLAIR